MLLTGILAVSRLHSLLGIDIILIPGLFIGQLIGM